MSVSRAEKGLVLTCFIFRLRRSKRFGSGSDMFFALDTNNQAMLSREEKHKCARKFMGLEIAHNGIFRLCGHRTCQVELWVLVFGLYSLGPFYILDFCAAFVLFLSFYVKNCYEFALNTNIAFWWRKGFHGDSLKITLL